MMHIWNWVPNLSYANCKKGEYSKRDELLTQPTLGKNDEVSYTASRRQTSFDCCRHPWIGFRVLIHNATDAPEKRKSNMI